MTMEVRGPDGIVVRFPDGTDPATIDRVMREATAKQPAASADMGVGDYALDAVKGLGRGAMEGVAAIPGLPGDMVNLADQGMGAATQWIGDKVFGERTPEQRAKIDAMKAGGLRMPTSKGIVGVVDSATGGALEYTPKSKVGEYAKTIGQFAPAAALGGPASLLKYGVVPAVASETAGQITKGSGMEPYARLAGALLGAGGMALASRSSATSTLASQLPKHVKASEIDAAETMIREGQSRGVALTWPEALSKVTKGRVDLTDIQRWVEQTKGGRQVMSPFMADRPGQVRIAGEDAVNELSRGARMVDPVMAGLKVQRVSTGALTDLRKRINGVTDTLYKNASATHVDPQAFATLKADPLFAHALKQVRAEPSYARYIDTYSDDSIQVLDQIKKFLDRGAEPIIGGSNTSAAGYAATAGDVKRAATKASPEYAAALDLQTRMRRGALEPAENGPLGKMAGTTDLNQQGRALLPQVPAEGSAKVVAQTVLRLVRKDPDAAFQLVRNHVKSVFDESMQNLSSGPNQFGGARFAAVIKGNPEQAKSLEAAVKALPGGNWRWEGFNKFLDVVQTTGLRKPAGSPTEFNRLISEGMKGGSIVGEGATIATSPGRALTVIRDFYERFRLGQNSEALARIITDPNSAELLKKIARTRGAQRSAAVAALIETATVHQRVEGWNGVNAPPPAGRFSGQATPAPAQ